MIELDRVGVIKSGEDAGRQIKVSEASLGKSGYYLFVCNDFNDENADVADHHFELLKDMEECFEEDGWEIKWL